MSAIPAPSALLPGQSSPFSPLTVASGKTGKKATSSGKVEKGMKFDCLALLFMLLVAAEQAFIYCST